MFNYIYKMFSII